MAVLFGLPAWLGGCLVFICGATSYVCLMLAENDKQQQDLISTAVVNGVNVCYYGKDPSPALSAVAVAFMFMGAVIANVLSGVPGVFGTMRVFTTYHRVMVGIWYFFCWAGTITSIIITSYASWQQATHHRNASQNIQTAVNPNTISGILCPSVKTGLFGGMGFVMIGTTALWIGFLSMGDTARYEATQEEAGYKGAYVGAQAGPAAPESEMVNQQGGLAE